jgi:hypothetical protein
LSDGTGFAFHHAGSFIYACKIAVKVAGIAFAAGDVPAERGDFPEGLAIVGHIRKHHQDMHAAVESHILGHGQGGAGSNQPLDGRVVRQVDRNLGAERHAGFHGILQAVVVVPVPITTRALIVHERAGHTVCWIPIPVNGEHARGLGLQEGDRSRDSVRVVVTHGYGERVEAVVVILDVVRWSSGGRSEVVTD